MHFRFSSCHLPRQAAETAFAGVKGVEGAVELFGGELGPHRVEEEQLGVRALPEQEVREPALTASPDEEVDVREDPAVTDGGACRVVDRDAEVQPVPAFRRPLGALDRGAEAWRQAVSASDDRQADAAVDAVGGLVPDDLLEEIE